MMRRSSSLASSRSGSESIGNHNVCTCDFKADLAAVGCCFKERFLEKMVFYCLVDGGPAGTQKEGVACQMVGCHFSRAAPFKDTISMLRHLRECTSFERGEYWCPKCEKRATITASKKGHCSWTKKSKAAGKVREFFTGARSKSSSIISESGHFSATEGSTAEIHRFFDPSHAIEQTSELSPDHTAAQLPDVSATRPCLSSHENKGTSAYDLPVPAYNQASELDSNYPSSYGGHHGHALTAPSPTTAPDPHDDKYRHAFAPTYNTIPSCSASFANFSMTNATVPMPGWPIAEASGSSPPSRHLVPPVDPQPASFLESLGTSSPQYCDMYSDEPESIHDDGGFDEAHHPRAPTHGVSSSGHGLVESRQDSPVLEGRHPFELPTPQRSLPYGVHLQEPDGIATGSMSFEHEAISPLVERPDDLVAPLNVRPPSTAQLPPSPVEHTDPDVGESHCQPIADEDPDSSLSPNLEDLIAFAEQYRCDFPECPYRPRHTGNRESFLKYKRKHMRIHKGTKYPCDLCGRELSRPDNLKTHHQRWHSSGSSESIPELEGTSSSSGDGGHGFWGSEGEEEVQRQKKRTKTEG